MNGERSGLWQKIGVQLIVLILVCSIVPLGVTTYIAESQAKSALEHKSVERKQAEVESVVENAQTRSEFYERQIRVVETHPAVRRLVEERYSNEDLGERADEYEKGAAYPELMGDEPAYTNALEFFDEVAAQNPNIDMIRVFWRDGNVLAGHKLGEEDTRDYKADKSWFEATMDPNEIGEDEVYVSAINIARATNSPAIRYAMPITHQGERVGLVIINYKAKQITEPVTSMDLGEGGYGMLVNPDYTNAEGKNLGALYVANGEDSSLAFDESAAGDIAVSGEQFEGESGTFEFTKEGTNWYAAYQRLELGDTEYYAVAAVPYAQMMAAARSIEQQSILVAGVAAVLVVVVGWFAARRYSRPIRRLATDAEAVAEGDLEHDIATSAVTAELENLTGATRQMKENVVEALDEAEEQQELAERERQEAEELTRHLEQKASEYERVMTRCAEGDLTERMETDSQSEAMNAIGRSFNEMLGDWEEVVADIKSFADEVATSSTEVTSGAAEVQEASEEVSESMIQISEGSKEQSESLDEVADEMNDLSATIEEIASTADTVARRSDETATVTDSGRDAAEEAIDEMRTVERTARESVEGVRELDRQMEKIDEITDVIQDITEQTNLLALNANIEAARAENGGEGFAVVADEVKTLAEETKESAQEIDEVVQEVRELSEMTVDDIVETEERISEGVEIVAEAADAFEEVAGKVEDTDAGVQEINDATDSQAASTQEVVSMVEDSAAISEETTAESQNVAAASEEQTASLDEVTTRAGELAERSRDLQAMLDEFEVGAGDTAAGAGGFDFENASAPVATDGRGD
jgi:methyl-accepting chemotaxis protein